MKATECKCIVCGKQAVAFWPVIDPDIPSNPYCRECLDKEKKESISKALKEGLFMPYLAAMMEIKPKKGSG